MAFAHTLVSLVKKSSQNGGGKKMQRDHLQDLMMYRQKHRHTIRAIRYMVSNCQEEISLESIAEMVGTSKFNVCKVFQRIYGTSPMRWLWKFRTVLAYQLIISLPHKSLTEIAFSCGFTSSAHFSRNFKKVYGLTPSELRDVKNTTVTPNYATPATQEGVKFGKNDDTVVQSQVSGFTNEFLKLALN